MLLFAETHCDFCLTVPAMSKRTNLDYLFTLLFTSCITTGSVLNRASQPMESRRPDDVELTDETSAWFR